MPLFIALGLSAASVVGAGIQAGAAKSAAKTQKKTAQENRALSEQYTTASLGDLDKALAGAIGTQEPYRQAGESALSQIMDLLGLSGPEASQKALSNFTTSPGYDFRVGEGVKALDRSANARGNLYSGAQGKALVDYGQNMGANEFDAYYNRLSDVAGSGQQAAGNTASALLGTGANKAQTRLGGLSAVTGANSQAGAAQAGGTVGAANAWNNGLSNLSTVWGNYAGSQPTALSQQPTYAFGSLY